MLQHIELLAWAVVFPYVMFGYLLEHIAEIGEGAFEPRIWLAGVWAGAFGVRLLPDWIIGVDDQKPLSVFESIALSHVGQIPTPIVLLALGFALSMAAVAVVRVQKRSR